MKKQFSSWLLLLLFPWVNVYAIKVVSLYKVEVPVASQGQDLKEQAMQDGFLQVLMKVSSDPQIDKNPIIKGSLDKADYYVQEYSYSAATPSSSEYLLQIRYNVDDVNRLLKKAGVLSWGINRPLVLVWLEVTDKDQQTEIIDSDTSGRIFTTMKMQSKKYGLPLIFPMMDMDEVEQISGVDFKDETLATLKEAAKRYAPDALLLGKMKENDKGFLSQWELVVDNHQWSWEIAGKTSQSVIAAVIDQITQTLVKQTLVATQNTSERWLKLEVNNISQRKELATLIEYLKQLAQVQQVELSQVKGPVVQLSVLISGSIANFEKNIAVDERLRLQDEDPSGTLLVYQWIR